MKSRLIFIAVLAFAGAGLLVFGQVRYVSQLTRTNAVHNADLVMLDVHVGGTQYVTRTIVWSNLVASLSTNTVLEEGEGTVTSVGLNTLPAQFGSNSGPITTSGSLGFTNVHQSANRILAGPTSGGAANPTYRALVSADLPAGLGSVTSVGLNTLPAQFGSNSGPVTSSGSLGFSNVFQLAHTFLAGPASGSAANPAYRAIAAADVPGYTVADLASNNDHSGTTLAGVVAGEAVSQLDLVYVASNGKWSKADANAAGKFPCRGVAIAGAALDADPGAVLTGIFRHDAWSWTAGGTLFLSTAAGGLTQTAPSASGDCVQVVGYALSATVVFFNITGEYLELQ